MSGIDPDAADPGDAAGSASSLLGLDGSDETVVQGWSAPTADAAAPAVDPLADVDPTAVADGQPASAADEAAQAGSWDPAEVSPLGASDDLDVESLVLTLETVTAERDSHLADLQRLTADFSNFRKQATKRQSETVTSAGAGVAEKLLPVLDACEAAIAQGSDDVQPIFAQLLETLTKEGLEQLGGADVAFDPLMHEAVIHEPGEGEPTVAEVLRTGYLWNGRVIRPAMVKVLG